jgi:hypothetical protein
VLQATDTVVLIGNLPSTLLIRTIFLQNATFYHADAIRTLRPVHLCDTSNARIARYGANGSRTIETWLTVKEADRRDRPI